MTTISRWHAGAVALAACFVAVGCADRLTPARAATILRHSKAFLSGSDESHPVFDRVSALTAIGGPTPESKEGESCVAEFSYHWPGDADGLTARAVLRRYGGSWSVDDQGTKALVPSWPQLPRALGPAWPALPPPSHGPR